jgi:hypothetical protein
MRIARGISVTNINKPVGITYDADAQAFITASGISGTEATATNQLVIDLKAANIWTKFKSIYPVVGGSASSHAVNLKQPGTFNLSFATGWTHSSTGMTPNGATYANTNIIPSISLSLNSLHISFYSRTNANPGGIMSGAINTSQGCAIQASVYGTNNGSIFDSYNSTLGAGRLLGSNVADSRGFAVFSRSSSSSSKIFWNSVQNGAITTTGGALPNTYSMFIGARNQDGTGSTFDNRQCAFASIGDGLTDAEALSFYNAVQTYQTTLGRQV